MYGPLYLGSTLPDQGVTTLRMTRALGGKSSCKVLWRLLKLLYAWAENPDARLLTAGHMTFTMSSAQAARSWWDNGGGGESDESEDGATWEQANMSKYGVDL